MPPSPGFCGSSIRWPRADSPEICGHTDQILKTGGREWERRRDVEVIIAIFIRDKSSLEILLNVVQNSRLEDSQCVSYSLVPENFMCKLGDKPCVCMIRV